MSILQLKLRLKKTMRIAGLMSGTSADGIDTAIIEYGPGGLKVLAFETVKYDSAIRRLVFRMFEPGTASLGDVGDLNFALGRAFGQAVVTVCRKHRIAVNSLDLIGSHGQTIFHNPTGRRIGKQLVKSTLQIGEPSIISQVTNVTTVADFRPADIAAGGEGAPLVPFTDYLLFSQKNKNMVIQNIGGIANLTFLRANGKTKDICAFDTGPGNMIIDSLASIITGGRLFYDKDGRIAASGVVNKDLLIELMAHPYIKKRPPKSTGREMFGREFAQRLWAKSLRMKVSPADLAATATAFTAASIANAYKKFLPCMPDEIILCGGGSRNPTMVSILQGQCPETSVKIMDELGVNADAKEAISFAILAYCTMHSIPNNAPGATGAKKQVILGKIIPAQKS